MYERPVSGLQVSSELLEAVNGTLFIAYFCLAYFFVSRLKAILSDNSEERRLSLREKYEAAAPVIAILVLISSDVIIRGTVWVNRFLVNHDMAHYARSLKDVFSFSILFGLVVGLTGCICVERQFSPESKLKRLLLFTVVFSTTFGFGNAYLW